MPTFHTADISVHLKRSPLAPSLTHKPSTQPYDLARRRTLANQAALANGESLKEYPVAWVAGGDGEQSGGGPGARLGFLGKEIMVPFLCVGVNASDVVAKVENGIQGNVTGWVGQRSGHGRHASLGSVMSEGSSSLTALGSTPQRSPDVIRTERENLAKSIFEVNTVDVVHKIVENPNTENTSSTNSEDTQPATTAPPPAPPPDYPEEYEFQSFTPFSRQSHALTLDIDFSTKGRKRINKFISHAQDMKVDVFLNGQLTHSTYVCAKLRSQPPESQLRLSGLKTAKIEEKSWVLRRCLDTHEAVEDTSSLLMDAEMRWKAIGNALKCYADAAGVDEKSNKPPSSHYLESLASMQIPDMFKTVQALTKPTFAVLDVVITLGQGSKLLGFMAGVERISHPKFAIPGQPRAMEPLAKAWIKQNDGQTGKIPSLAIISVTDDVEGTEVLEFDGPFSTITVFPGATPLLPEDSSVPATVHGPKPSDTLQAGTIVTNSLIRDQLTFRRPEVVNDCILTATPEKVQLGQFSRSTKSMKTLPPPLHGQIHNPWSIRPRSRARSPVIKRTVSSPAEQSSSGSSRTNDKPNVVVMIDRKPKEVFPQPSKPHPPPLWQRAGNSLRLTEQISQPQTFLQSTGFSRGIYAVSDYRPILPKPTSSNEGAMSCSTESMNSADRTLAIRATALREGAIPDGPLMNAITRATKSSNGAMSRVSPISRSNVGRNPLFPQLLAGATNSSIVELTEQQRLGAPKPQAEIPTIDINQEKPKIPTRSLGSPSTNRTPEEAPISNDPLFIHGITTSNTAPDMSNTISRTSQYVTDSSEARSSWGWFPPGYTHRGRGGMRGGGEAGSRLSSEQPPSIPAPDSASNSKPKRKRSKAEKVDDIEEESVTESHGNTKRVKLMAPSSDSINEPLTQLPLPYPTPQSPSCAPTSSPKTSSPPAAQSSSVVADDGTTIRQQQEYMEETTVLHRLNHGSVIGYAGECPEDGSFVKRVTDVPNEDVDVNAEIGVIGGKAKAKAKAKFNKNTNENEEENEKIGDLDKREQEPGTKKTPGLRQIRGEHVAEFEELNVICGVRFLVVCCGSGDCESERLDREDGGDEGDKSGFDGSDELEGMDDVAGGSIVGDVESTGSGKSGGSAQSVEASDEAVNAKAGLMNLKGGAPTPRDESAEIGNIPMTTQAERIANAANTAGIAIDANTPNTADTVNDTIDATRPRPRRGGGGGGRRRGRETHTRPSGRGVGRNTSSGMGMGTATGTGTARGMGRGVALRRGRSGRGGRGG